MCGDCFDVCGDCGDVCDVRGDCFDVRGDSDVHDVMFGVGDSNICVFVCVFVLCVIGKGS